MRTVCPCGQAGLQRPFTSTFFEHYISLLLFLLLPFLSLVTWLVFKKAPYNYWEHFLLNVYLSAQTNILLLGIKLVSLF